MPVDAHKTYRYFIVDQCLRNRHRHYTIDDLLKSCNIALEKKGYRPISKRSLQQDLSDMELSPYNARFDRVKDGHKTIYRYAEGFSGIKLYEISDEERARVNKAIDVVKRFEGTPQYDWVRLCLQHIVSGDFMSDNRSIISFQNNPNHSGIENFETLLKAIAEKRPLKILYHPYPYKDRKNNDNIVVRKEESYNIHPYHLKQFNDRWFLVGQTEGKEYIGKYPLDRIMSIEPLHKIFKETDIDIEEHFDNAVGVTVFDVVRKVQLKVDKIRYAYIKSKPLHWSQKEIEDKETPTHVVLQLKVCLNNELEAAILSYGNDIEVLEPKVLRNNIASKVKSMYECYNP